MRCCVLGEIALTVQCPQLSDSRFGVYCHSKATSQIYVPLTNITHPLGHRSKFHSFGYLTDVNSVTRGNTFLVHISWGRHWQKVAKLNWDCWPLQFSKRTVSYSPWVKEVTEAILRRLWWGGCQGWNRRTSWLRPSSPEMQKRANRSDIGSNSSGPALFLLILDIFTLILDIFTLMLFVISPLILGIFTLISGVFFAFYVLIFPREKFH